MTCSSTEARKKTSLTGSRFSFKRKWWVSLNRSLSQSFTNWWTRQSTRRLSTSLALEEKTWRLWTFWSTWLWCPLLTHSTSRSQVPWARGTITTTLWLYSSASFGSGPMLMSLYGSHTTLPPWSWDPTLVSSLCSSTQSEFLSEMSRSSRTSRSLSRYSRVSCLIRKSPSLSLTHHRSSKWLAALVFPGCCSRWPLERKWSSTTTPFNSRYQSWSWSSCKSTQLLWEIDSKPAMISLRLMSTATSSLCSSSWL